MVQATIFGETSFKKNVFLKKVPQNRLILRDEISIYVIRYYRIGLLCKRERSTIRHTIRN